MNVLDRPNILWILCDELRTDALGCYGHSSVKMSTPNIDALAADGTRFTRYYCSSTTCVPARVAMMTGLSPEQSGVFGPEALDSPPRELENVVTLPEVFAANGYRTVQVGRTHLPRGLNRWSHDDPSGSDIPQLSELLEGSLCIQPRGVPLRLGAQFPPEVPFPGEWVTRNAVEWMESQDASPFLLRVSYLQPHTPVAPPTPYDGQYDPQVFDGGGEVGVGQNMFESQFAKVIDSTNLTLMERQRAQALYYGSVSWLDTQVGTLLGALEKCGLAKNTVIVFTSDHGASLGERGLYAKHIFAPNVHRIPLIISGHTVSSTVDSNLAQSVDLAPTLMNLAGIPVPDQFKGINLMKGLKREFVVSSVGFGEPGSFAFPGRRSGAYCSEGWPRRACIRSEQYRLEKNVRQNGSWIHEQHRKDMFFVDTKVDIGETQNMVDRTEYVEAIRVLEAALDSIVFPTSRS